MRFRLSAPTTCALPAWPALAGSIAPAISTPWISSSGATRTASLDHLYSQTLTFAFKLQTHKSWKLLASVTLYDQTQGFIGFTRYHLSLVLFEIAPERPMRDLKAVAEMSPNDTPELFTDHPGCWSTFIPPYLEPFWPSLEHHCWLPLEALWHVPNCHALVLHLQWNVHLASSWKSACSTPPFQNLLKKASKQRIGQVTLEEMTTFLWAPLNLLSKQKAWFPPVSCSQLGYFCAVHQMFRLDNWQPCIIRLIGKTETSAPESASESRSITSSTASSGSSSAIALTPSWKPMHSW